MTLFMLCRTAAETGKRSFHRWNSDLLARSRFLITGCASMSFPRTAVVRHSHRASKVTARLGVTNRSMRSGFDLVSGWTKRQLGNLLQRPVLSLITWQPIHVRVTSSSSSARWARLSDEMQVKHNMDCRRILCSLQVLLSSSQAVCIGVSPLAS